MSCGGNVAIFACGVNLWMSLQICVILSCIRGMLQHVVTLGFGVRCKGVGSCVVKLGGVHGAHYAIILGIQMKMHVAYYLILKIKSLQNRGIDY